MPSTTGHRADTCLRWNRRDEQEDDEDEKWHHNLEQDRQHSARIATCLPGGVGRARHQCGGKCRRNQPVSVAESEQLLGQGLAVGRSAAATGIADIAVDKARFEQLLPFNGRSCQDQGRQQAGQSQVGTRQKLAGTRKRRPSTQWPEPTCQPGLSCGQPLAGLLSRGRRCNTLATTTRVGKICARLAAGMHQCLPVAQDFGGPDDRDSTRAHTLGKPQSRHRSRRAEADMGDHGTYQRPQQTRQPHVHGRVTGAGPHSAKRRHPAHNGLDHHPGSGPRLGLVPPQRTEPVHARALASQRHRGSVRDGPAPVRHGAIAPRRKQHEIHHHEP